MAVAASDGTGRLGAAVATSVLRVTLAARYNGGNSLRLIRIGAALGIVGSVGAAVGNILHPGVPTDTAAAARVIAHSAIWVPAHLVIAVTVFMMLFGLLALTVSLRHDRAHPWGVLGLLAGLVGVAIGFTLMAADGVTAKYAAVAWTNSVGAEEVPALSVASFAEMISFGLVVMFNIVFGGLTYLFYGIAVVLSDQFPTWAGWLIAVIGVASIGIGTIQALTGTSSPTIELLTIITPTLFTMWTVLMCVLVLRQKNAVQY